VAAKQLEKQIDKALVDFERWLKRQPGWKHGNIAATSGSARSGRGPAVLGESDCALQFARLLNKQGVAWRDIHINVTPARWLVDAEVAGPRPKRIDLAVVDRDRLAKRDAPFNPRKQKDFLFDAIFDFTLAGNGWQRELAGGRQARPPRRAAIAADRSVVRMEKYLRDLWTRRGYIVVVEEADHKLPKPPKASGGLSVHHLKAF
jgi:hypothetical protein